MTDTLFTMIAAPVRLGLLGHVLKTYCGLAGLVVA
jgi:hypothetical protein